MDSIIGRLKAYIDNHPFDPGDSDCETVLDQLYQAYAESRESDPPEISDGFKELKKRGDYLKYYIVVDIGASSGRHIVGWMDTYETLRS